MNVKMLGSALLAAWMTGGAVEAQSLAQVGGPANTPPRGFTGQQFVDSRGCLFLRAGYGNGVNWVARVDRNHKPICGMPPTGGAAAQAAVAADMAPDPQAVPQAQAAAPLVVVPVVTPEVAAPTPPAPKSGGFNLANLFGTGRNGAQPSPAPAPTVFTTAAAPAPAPVQRPVAAQPYQTAGVATSVAGVQCYDAAPKLERVMVASGTQLVCTRGDGSATGWLPPVVANARQAQIAAATAPLVVVPQMAPPVQMASVQVAPVAVMVPQIAAPQPAARSHTLPKPPKGWVYAWKDDRLNPLRGQGTAAGQAQQDLVWTRTVPMVLVADQPHKATAAPASGVRTSVSTMSAAVAEPIAQKAPVIQQVSTAPEPQASGRLMVQVGSFGEPANARGTLGKLASLGLPVASANVTRKGKVLQVVYAGPFASLAEAQAGLAAVHSAGFGDAFLR